MAELRCLPIVKYTDGPLLLEHPGTCSGLQNMRIRPGGYVEARGGMERIKPSGGSPHEPIGSGIGGTPAAIQISTSFGWIRTQAAAGSYTGNLQFSSGNYLAFATGAVNDAIYFGSDGPFGRIGMKLQVASTSTLTFVYEYWNGAAWSALTTQETITWTAITTNPIDTYASWQIPSDWATTVTGTGAGATGDILKYWMRIRISVSTVVAVLPRIGYAFGSWIGMRELYIMSQIPYAAGPNGNLLRYDQSAAGGTTEWFQVNGSGLYSSPESTPSVSAYRGRMFFTEPKETQRWDGAVLQNVGNVAPATGGFSNRHVGVGFGAGIYRLYYAFGYGPLQNDVYDGVTNTQLYFDVKPMYGWSQATLLTVAAPVQDPNDANAIVLTAGNERIDLDWGAISIPADASCMAVYMTQDVTGVGVAQRPTVPAQRIINFNRRFITNVTSTTQVTTGFALPDNAILYDNTPPKGCRYCFVYENRLFLGGGPDSTWYWSDPFLPDQFNRTFANLSLVRAQGGRDMGGFEFANYAVLQTEDQTWGLQHVDLDVPRLVPIAPGIGCIAPWAACVGDGFAVWPARDGIYAWDGGRAGPKKVSGSLKYAFASLNFEAHGGSRAVIHNHKYDLTLIDAKNGTIGNAYTLDLETWEWSTRTTNDKKVPMCLIHAPLGHADAGVPHALYGKATVGTSGASDATTYSPCIAEWTTQDDGTNFVCSATMHFPVGQYMRRGWVVEPGATFTPSRFLAYYQTDTGWQTPTATWTGTPIFGDPGTLSTGTVKAGGDYSILGSEPSQTGAGTTDLKCLFSATTQSGGTVGGQRLMGGMIEGEFGEVPQGAV